MSQPTIEVSLGSVLELAQAAGATEKYCSNATELTLIKELFPNSAPIGDFSESWLNFVEFTMLLEETFDVGNINDDIALEIRRQTIGELLNRIRHSVATSNK